MAIDWIRFYLSSVWSFMSSVPVPGFSFSFANLFVGFVAVSVGFKILILFLGTGFSSSWDSEPAKFGADPHKPFAWNGGNMPERRSRRY